MNNYLLIVCLFGVPLAVGCAPVTSTRIGPPLGEKGEHCAMEVLPPGAVPERPWRDVGMVSVQHCPDYERGGCRSWVVKEACRLGGDVVYAPAAGSVDDRPAELSGGVTYSLTVGAYIANLMPEADDVVLNSTPAVPCEEDATQAAEDAEDPEQQMCTE